MKRAFSFVHGLVDGIMVMLIVLLAIPFGTTVMLLVNGDMSVFKEIMRAIHSNEGDEG